MRSSLLAASAMFLALAGNAQVADQASDKAGNRPALAPATSAPPVKEVACDADPKELIRLTEEHDILNDLKQRDYTYKERGEAHFLNKDGSVKKTEIETNEVFVLDGEVVSRQIAKDDKPLPEKDAAKEDEKVQKIIDRHKKESESDRQKRLANYDKAREDARKFVLEVGD